MTLTIDSDLTATDFFCGMGGSSSGLREAGFRISLAANHWDRAIESHSANHPGTEHLCADLQVVEPRHLPRTHILWASPICTELSQAGGKKRREPQMDLWEEHGHVPDPAFERTRVTFWEVLRAAEFHRYKAVLIENVAEAAGWELFDTFLNGLSALGYNYQFVSVSAAHVGDETNPHAPQWRDRMYIVCTLKGIPLPDVDPKPLAYCYECDEVVQSIQFWKKGPHTRRIGKYDRQYHYICPNTRCKNARVEPFVAPAVEAIDWSDLGHRIGDREVLGMKPLSPATIRRITVGLETLGDPSIVAAAGNTFERPGYTRAWPAAITPLGARQATGTDALAMTEPMVTMLRNHGRAHSTSHDALPAFTSGGYHHGLTVPPGAFVMKQYGGRLKDQDAVKPPTVPLHAAVAQSSPFLVIPYRKGSKPLRADAAPLSTMTSIESHGVVPAPAVDVEDCYFRMLKPREAANAQRFDHDYHIAGNQGEQQMQAGNAVPVNVAHWLGRQTAQVLA
jgi:DNA (cytosine-5)-methyltransferase 1